MLNVRPLRNKICSKFFPPRLVSKMLVFTSWASHHRCAWLRPFRSPTYQAPKGYHYKLPRSQMCPSIFPSGTTTTMAAWQLKISTSAMSQWPTSTPPKTTDTINVGVLLPSDSWNERLQGIGGNGYSWQIQNVPTGHALRYPASCIIDGLRCLSGTTWTSPWRTSHTKHMITFPESLSSNGIRYLERITQIYRTSVTLGARCLHTMAWCVLYFAHDYYKLFDAPMMGHCFGRKGGYPSTMFDRLVAWVESDNAPTSLPVKYSPEDGKMYDRILCPYPQRAKYEGTGDVTCADAFYCAQSVVSV